MSARLAIFQSCQSAVVELTAAESEKATANAPAGNFSLLRLQCRHLVVLGGVVCKFRVRGQWKKRRGGKPSRRIRTGHVGLVEWILRRLNTNTDHQLLHTRAARGEMLYLLEALVQPIVCGGRPRQQLDAIWNIASTYCTAAIASRGAPSS